MKQIRDYSYLILLWFIFKLTLLMYGLVSLYLFDTGRTTQAHMILLDLAQEGTVLLVLVAAIGIEILYELVIEKYVIPYFSKTRGTQ